MSLSGDGEVRFDIDESKITVLTRAARLKPQAVGYLAILKQNLLTEGMANGDADGSFAENVALLDEIIAWLNEMET